MHGGFEYGNSMDIWWGKPGNCDEQSPTRNIMQGFNWDTWWDLSRKNGGKTRKQGDCQKDIWWD